MTFTKLILALACLISITLVGQEPNVAPKSKVTQLMSRTCQTFLAKKL